MKVEVSGSKVAVDTAVASIRTILRFYHSEATHPGLVHEEMVVPQDCYGILIGPKGSNLNHINSNFGVSVNIPRDISVNKNVVVVGAPRAVAKAAAYIRKQVCPDDEDEDGGVGAADAGGGGFAAAAAAAGGADAAGAEGGAEEGDAAEDNGTGEMSGFGSAAAQGTENAWGGGSGTGW